MTDSPVRTAEMTGDAAAAVPFDPSSLTQDELDARVRALGGAPVHARRWFRALHREGVADPARVPELGRNLTARLQAVAAPAPVRLDEAARSDDGTVKLRVTLSGGAVECVLIPDKQRLTLCLSSQIGCAVGCSFCATARMGLVRNLTPGEIVGQVRVARQVATETFGRAVTNVVFMGMGEPLHNWSAVHTAIELLNDSNAYNLARRRITVSTSGIVPHMAEVVRLRVDLALSLHAVDDAARNALIPLNRRWPIAEVIAELRRLALEERGRIMIQYLLMAGVNDGHADASRLAALVRDFPCHVNLLQYNPAPGLPYERPDDAAVSRFKRWLMDAGVRVYHRSSRGLDIDGACGQLALQARERADAVGP